MYSVESVLGGNGLNSDVERDDSGFEVITMDLEPEPVSAQGKSW